MKILIYGTGGVGGYYGARLEEAGNDVTFIARGKHLKAIQKNGLYLKSIDGDYLVSNVKVTDSIADLKTDFDLIILGVKSWQVEKVAQDIKPILREKTMVLPLQNGADNTDKLLKVLDEKHVLAGLCKIYSKVDDYGIINHFAHTPELILGELNNEKSERILEVKSAFETAKFKTTIPEDIFSEIWKKFMFICTVSGLGGLTRVSIGAMVESEETKNLLRNTAEEIYKIAIAKRINLPTNIVDGIMKFIENQPYDSTASTQRDIMEGRPSELENFNGYIVEQGKKYGIETTVNSFIYNCLLPQENNVRNN
ncbi:ketopantoate reductase family protein [Urechidicola croceus]|uniref:2-dehydropantoate 2-reductase n=1 Tax=Urechidicola croceus TaxID=1850246 RepID=A0A1D8P8J7_9FLAO|nr:2-dehydropantoate 2-reductase [Urechidicola croceus]AOW20908.1 2-dehydropantoate 2-reductase [Urechidicola croceus]